MWVYSISTYPPKHVTECKCNTRFFCISTSKSDSSLAGAYFFSNFWLKWCSAVDFLEHIDDCRDVRCLGSTLFPRKRFCVKLTIYQQFVFGKKLSAFVITRFSIRALPTTKLPTKNATFVMRNLYAEIEARLRLVLTWCLI